MSTQADRTADEAAGKTEEPLSTWLEGHHRVDLASDAAEERHIYAQNADGSPVYGESAEVQSTVDVAVPLHGALTLELHIEQDPEKGSLSWRLGCAVPFRSPVRLGEAKGSSSERVSITFQNEIADGRATLYLKGPYFRLHNDSKVMGKHVTFDVKLCRAF
ncbi:hypothetical protein ACSNOH_01105 [Streptomyces sp. URMC 127]|uniref:hypothetical protein n=1 Tax=Streptomyces sp. URMC 127 TaxID=3423402 RepID=UPI003F1C644B